MALLQKGNSRWITCCALVLSVVLVAAGPPTTKPTSQPTTKPASQPTTQQTKKEAKFQKALPKEIMLPTQKVGATNAKVILFTGGLKSYYEPCGCQADMLGGLPRLGALVGGIRHKKIRSLRIDAGNLYFETLKIASSKRVQSRIKAQMVADMFKMIGYHAIGVGPSDLVFGVKFLKELAKRTGAHTIASNIVDEQNKPILPTHAVVDWMGEKIGFFSLTGTPTRANKKDPWPKGFWKTHHLKLLDPVKTAQKMIAMLKKAGAQRIVLLSTLGFGPVESLLQKVKGIDLTVEGAEDDELPAPRLMQGGFLVSTPKEGQKAGVLALYTQKAGLPWAKVATAGQRKLAIKKMKDQVGSYLRQAAQMKKQGAAFAPLAQIYVNQANALRKKIQVAEQNTSTKASLKKAHNGYLHFLIPLSQKMGEDPTIAKRLSRYEKEVKEANLKALKNLKPILKNAKGNFYEGVNKCRMCHMPAYNFWKKTRHARAYNTLVKKGKQFDLDCIGCHVVGWLKPGGLYDIKNPQRLANVQCESCHSYGGLHAASANKKLIVRNVPESTCKGCHHPPHDKKFVFNEKLKKILGKGHGEKRLAQILKQK